MTLIERISADKEGQISVNQPYPRNQRSNIKI